MTHQIFTSYNHFLVVLISIYRPVSYVPHYHITKHWLNDDFDTLPKKALTYTKNLKPKARQPQPRARPVEIPTVELVESRLKETIVELDPGVHSVQASKLFYPCPPLSLL